MNPSQVVGIIAMAIVGSCLANDNSTNVIREKRHSTHYCPGSQVVHFQDHNDCHAYFQCSNNEAIRFVCDSNMMYNPNTETCQHMNRAPSGCGRSSGVSGRSDVVPGGVYNCLQPYGQFQDTSDCSRYYSCHDSIARLVDCPRGQRFDPDYSECSYIEHPRGCHLNDGYWGNVGTRDDEEDVRFFECTVRNGDFPDESDCGAFWKCEHFVATSMHCPQDWLFYPHPRSNSRGACRRPSDHHHPPGCVMPANYRW